MDFPNYALPHPRLTRAEYWLLETAVEGGIPLQFLDPDGYSAKFTIEHMFNKPGHGLDRLQLLDCLDGLFAAGLVEGEFSRAGAAVVPSKDVIRQAIVEKLPHTVPRLCYQLTPRGGKVWEAFAAPRWDRYLSEESDPDSRTGWITCQDRFHLRRHLDERQFVILDRIITHDTIQIEEIGPWEATYWKRLPHGYRARFQWTEAAEQFMPKTPLEQLVFGGFCEDRDGWYHWH